MNKILCSILAILFVFLTMNHAYAGDDRVTLFEIAKNLSQHLNVLDDSLEAAAKKTGEAGPNNDKLRMILSDLCKSNPDSVDCTFVGITGIMKVVEPAKYKSFEGADISKQEQIVRLHKTKKPVMSKLFLSVEKIWSIDVEYPVFSKDRKLQGSISILFEPEKLVGTVLNPYIKKTPHRYLIVQNNGICVFDSKKKLLGKDLKKEADPKKYPQLAIAVKDITKDRDGRGIYNVIVQDVGPDTDENVLWTTIELYETEWRIVLIRH